MSKVKFQFDKRTLTYKKVELNVRQRTFRILGYLAGASVFAVLVIVLFTTFFDSPKEKRLKREIAQLELQYKLLDKRMARVDQVLAELQEKDDDIYRVIFEAEPIPNSKNARMTAGTPAKIDPSVGIKLSRNASKPRTKGKSTPSASRNTVTATPVTTPINVLIARY